MLQYNSCSSHALHVCDCASWVWRLHEQQVRDLGRLSDDALLCACTKFGDELRVRKKRVKWSGQSNSVLLYVIGSIEYFIISLRVQFDWLKQVQSPLDKCSIHYATPFDGICPTHSRQVCACALHTTLSLHLFGHTPPRAPSDACARTFLLYLLQCIQPISVLLR